MLRQTMIALTTAALASGFFAANAQARGGSPHVHMTGGHSSGIRFGSRGRGFRSGPRFGAYGDWSVNCSPFGWQHSWPDGCF
jgi:hypothetical protein